MIQITIITNKYLPLNIMLKETVAKNLVLTGDKASVAMNFSAKASD